MDTDHKAPPDSPSSTSSSAAVTSSSSVGKKKDRVKPLFVDLHEKFDNNLLKRFYDELMIPNFPMEDGMVFSKISVKVY